MKQGRIDERGLLACPIREQAGDSGRNEGRRREQERQARPCGAGSAGRHGRRGSGNPRKRLEIEGEVSRGLKTLFRALLQAVPHDPFEPGVDVLVRLRQVRRLLRQDRRDRVGSGVAQEGPLAGQHLVENRSEGEEVRGLLRGPAPQLLGRHVAHRPHHDARFGSRRCRRQVGLLPAFRRRLQLGQPEVEDLDPAVPRHEEVLGLQVPVHDPLLVCRGEAPGDLNGVIDRLAARERAGAEALAQRLPLEKLGDDIRRAVDRADVVDGRDVGVIQGPGRPRLLFEPPQPIRVLRQRLGQDLDRHLSPEPRVPRPVHLAHPARSEGRNDLVRTEPGPRRQGHEKKLISS